MREAVIVALGRSPIGKAPKGTLKYTRPEDIGAQVLLGLLKLVPQLEPKEIDDIIIGCAFPEAEQGMNLAKVITEKAEMPVEVSGQTVNRFCSSGLQSIASAAYSIIAGQTEVIVAGGVESMSTIPMGGNVMCPNPALMSSHPEAYSSMGITAENVAEKYNISRQEQDAFAAESHRRAFTAQSSGRFFEEIIPVDATFIYEDEHKYSRKGIKQFTGDEGIRANVTVESLSKLKPVFKVNGSVTAGNSSQTSDGAAMVMLMSREKADQLGIKPLAKFISFATAGVPAELMGLGPIQVLPKALKIAGMTKEQIDLIELNEAFASQALACIRELELDDKRVNVNGGAIALGHPLGCTGTFLTVKLIHELKRRNQKYGVVSMCIGGGMGAAGIFELL